MHEGDKCADTCEVLGGQDDSVRTKRCGTKKDETKSSRSNCYFYDYHLQLITFSPHNNIYNRAYIDISDGL